MREADIQQAIRLALGLEPGLCLFRNNVGVAMHQGTNRPVQYGVGGKGGSDLVGLLEVPPLIVPVARFVALEVKKPGGRVSADQRDFLNLVRGKGGFGAVVYSVEEARAAVERCRRGERE